MQKHTTKNKNSYDFAIVGGGLTGLSLAVALDKLGKKVLLLDEGEKLGGANGAVSFNEYKLDKGLRFIPDTEQSHELLNFVASLIDTSIETTESESKKLCYESSELKKFLGFGEKAPEFIDELNYFLSMNELRVSVPIHQWVEKLVENYGGESIHPAYVTRFHVSEGRVSHLTYNTNKDIYADHFIYCGGIKGLTPLFAREEIPVKIHQKLAKSTVWTTLCLDLIHTEEVAPTGSLYVLNHGTKEVPEYFIGQFGEIAAEEEGSAKLYTSHWMTLLDQEVSEDSEQMATALKKIKRQLKRVYDDIFDKTQQERVSLIPSVLGQIDLGTKDPFQLPKIENFWLGSSQLSSYSNVLGALNRSMELFDRLKAELESQAELNEATPEAEPSSEPVQNL